MNCLNKFYNYKLNEYLKIDKTIYIENVNTLKIPGIYGFILLPSGWTSFRKYPFESSDKFDYIRGVVGDYGYIALALMLVMQFATKIGVSGLPHIFVSEVFPFKWVICFEIEILNFWTFSIKIRPWFKGLVHFYVE